MGDFEALIRIVVTVKVNAGVGRMIVRSVKGQELFISQIRYVFWVTPGIKAIRIVREKGLKGLSGKHVVRR